MMATPHGRGRGRGFKQKTESETQLRRPGDAQETSGSTLDLNAVTKEVQRMSLEGDTDANKVSDVVELMKKFCKTEENLRTVVSILHEKSLKDQSFGKIAALAFGTIATLEVGNLKLRHVLLKEVQKDFEQKDTMVTKDHRKFLNAICLLGEIFYNLRMADGSPIQVLAIPVLMYLDMLMKDLTEENVEVLAMQLILNGKDLKDVQSTKLEDLLLTVRSELISQSLSSKSRCYLLCVTELAAQKWSSFPEPVEKFYRTYLGETLSQGSMKI